MHWLDIVLIVILLINVIFGFWQGFIRACFSLAGIVIGIILASNYYSSLAESLGFISNPGTANIVAFVLIMIAVAVVAMITALLLRKLLEVIKLGCIDRIAGGILGLIIGTLFLGALLAGIVKFVGQGIVTDSLIARFLLDRFPLILSLLPNEFKVIRDFFK